MAGLVDISIKNFKHILNTPELQKYINEYCIVTHKSDGIKICIKITENKDFEVYYKNTRLHEEWFDGFCEDDYRKLDESKGVAQYKRIFDFLNSKRDKLQLLQPCVLFCEFIMNKATLTRTYKNFGDLVLLNVGDEWNNDRNEVNRVSNILGLKTPKLISQGILKDFINELDEYISIPSQFGGVEEGIILYFRDLNETFKLLQNDQHDKSVRKAKKDEYYESKEYYKRLKSLLKNVIKENKVINWNIIRETLKNNPLSTKFTELQQIEDTLEKALFYKSIKDAGKALIIGKFRILTNSHLKLIKEAFKDTNIKEVVICVVTGKDTQYSKHIRLEMINRLKEFYNISIVTHSSANIYSIFSKIGIPALKVYCGTDRFSSYSNMLENTYSEVVELQRDEDSLSATKIINNIDNYSYFIENTPECIHNMYNTLKSIY